MLKKTVALGALLTTISSMPTLAHSSYYKSGFLAGAHVGYSFGSGTFNGIANLNVAVVPLLSASGKANKSGPLIGLLGGYRHIFNQGFTIGADVTANIFGNNELKKQLNHTFAAVTSPFINHLKRNYSIIPSINFGKVLCDRFHVALGLGLGITRFKQQVDNVNALVSVSASQTKLGFVPSLRAEYAATQNVSFTGDVSYEMYQKVKKQFGQNAIPASPGSSYTSSISPKFLTLKIGAVYRF
jgi:hypothetical protein